jgi:hypothetical protein
MKTSQRDSVVLRGGKHDGHSVTIDFADDEYDVIAVGDGPSRAMYTFDRGEWRYDRTMRLDSIDEAWRVLEVPDFEFETTRSLGMSARPTSAAGIVAEMRAMNDVGIAYISRTVQQMKARGATLPEMLQKIQELYAELKIVTLEAALANHREYERKRIEYARPVTGR